MQQPPPLPPDRAQAPAGDPRKAGRPRRRRRRGFVPLLVLALLLGLAALIVVADQMHRQRRYERALALVDRGDGDRALPFLEVHARENPDDPGIWFALARARMAERRLEAGVQALGRVIELRPDHGDAHRLMGRALLTLDDLERAEPALERARELLSEDGRVWLDLGRLYFRQGRHLESETALRQAQVTDAPRGPTAALLGRVLYAQDRAEEGLMVLDGALMQDPDCPDVHFQLGEVHRLRGNPHVAVDRYDEARRLGERSLACALGLAIALHESGDLARARRELEGLVRTHEREAEPWYRMGRLREDQQDPAGALASYERCLALDAEHQAAGAHAAELRRTLGR